LLEDRFNQKSTSDFDLEQFRGNIQEEGLKIRRSERIRINLVSISEEIKKLKDDLESKNYFLVSNSRRRK
jgi:hypothetical protein